MAGTCVITATVVQPPPECPEAVIPLCPDGTLIPQPPDERGCPIPPICVPKETPKEKGIGAGAILGITLLGVGVLGAVIMSRRR